MFTDTYLDVKTAVRAQELDEEATKADEDADGYEEGKKDDIGVGDESSPEGDEEDLTGGDLGLGDEESEALPEVE